MKKKFLAVLAVTSLFATAVGAQERGPVIDTDPALEVDGGEALKSVGESLKNSVRRIEVYYNYADNIGAIHDAGVRGKLVLADCRAAFTCDRDSTHFFRMGVIDVDAAVVKAEGQDAKIVFNRGAVSIMEYMTKNGSYINVARVSYIKNNRSQYLDFILPVAVVTAAQNIDIKFDKKGKVKIFLQGNVEAGFVHNKFHQDEGYKDEGKATNLYAQAGLQGGFKFYNRVSLGGITRWYWDEQIKEQEYGLRADVKITKGFSIFLDGSQTNRLIQRETTGAAVPGLGGPAASAVDEKYWYAGAGLRFEF